MCGREAPRTRKCFSLPQPIRLGDSARSNSSQIHLWLTRMLAFLRCSLLLFLDLYFGFARVTFIDYQYGHKWCPTVRASRGESSKSSAKLVFAFSSKYYWIEQINVLTIIAHISRSSSTSTCECRRGMSKETNQVLLFSLFMDHFQSLNRDTAIYRHSWMKLWMFRQRHVTSCFPELPPAKLKTNNLSDLFTRNMQGRVGRFNTCSPTRSFSFDTLRTTLF